MSISLWVTAAVIVFLLVYDVYAVVTGGVKNTISWEVLQASKNYPVIPFAVGVVAGHLFWTNCG